MKITIEIPKEFEQDFEKDKFLDFFSRVKSNMKCFAGLCGLYEWEIAEMFIDVFNKGIISD